MTRAAPIILASAAAGLVACGDPDDRGGREDGPRDVVPYEIVEREFRRDIETVATARALTATEVRAEASGMLRRLAFEGGARVEAGQPLAYLDDEEERLAVKLADVAVREAAQLLERYRRIEDTGAVSESQIDEARTRLESARLQLDQAELRLAERTVRAPFAGYVGAANLDPGARIADGDVITTLDDRSRLYLDFPVSEDVFGRLDVGDVVSASPFSAEDLDLPAEVVFVGARIDAASRAFDVRAAVANDDDRLRPGMSFKIEYSVPGRPYPAVPEAALVWGADGAYLWAVRDGAARRAPVVIVGRDGATVFVDGDLPQGSLIVAEGVQKVREGTPVALVASRATGGDAPPAGVGARG